MTDDGLLMTKTRTSAARGAMGIGRRPKSFIEGVRSDVGAIGPANCMVLDSHLSEQDWIGSNLIEYRAPEEGLQVDDALEPVFERESHPVAAEQGNGSNIKHVFMLLERQDPIQRKMPLRKIPIGEQFSSVKRRPLPY